MNIGRDISCCGMREIGALSVHRTPLQAMKAFAQGTLRRHHTNFRYAVFSEAVYRPYRGEPRRRPYGRDFAAYIKAEKLGKVTATGWHVNPNSGNKLKAWLWTIDWDALKVWAKRHRVAVSKNPLYSHNAPPEPRLVVAGPQVQDAINGLPQ